MISLVLYHTIISCLWTPTLYDYVVCIAESEIKVIHTYIHTSWRTVVNNSSVNKFRLHGNLTDMDDQKADKRWTV